MGRSSLKWKLGGTLLGVGLLVGIGSVHPARSAAAASLTPEQLQRQIDLRIWNSPSRQALTAMGLLALEQRLGYVTASNQPAGDGMVSSTASGPPANVRVNNPAEDRDLPCNTHSETTIRAIDSQHLVVGFNDSNGGCEVLTSYTGFGYSSNGGKTWTDGGNLQPPKGGFSAGDPGIAVDRQGRVFFSDIENAPGESPVFPALVAGRSYIGVRSSTDDGHTWSAPADATAGVIGSYDKPMIGVDDSGGKYDGTVYAAFTDFSLAPGDGVIEFSRSTNHGRTFSKPILLSDNVQYYQGAIPVVGPDGQVYVVWGTQLASFINIYIVESTNGGVTFSTPRLVTTVQDVGRSDASCGRETMHNGVRMLVWPVVAVDQTALTAPATQLQYRGTIYISFAAGAGQDEGNVYVLRSTDQGVSWSGGTPGHRLNDDKTQRDQFMPGISTQPGGRAAVIWYDRRNDSKDVYIQVYGSRTTDGGQTWSANFKVSNTTFEGRGNNYNSPTEYDDPTVATCYMGDYNQVTAVGSRYVAAWGDNRDSYINNSRKLRYMANVYFAGF